MLHVLDHLPLGLAMLVPTPATTGSPLGRYGPAVAALIAIGVVAAAVAIHVVAALGIGAGTDPFIDSAALLVIGVVLGATALGGQVQQVQQAHEAAIAANIRLDKAGIPPAADGTSTNA